MFESDQLTAFYKFAQRWREVTNGQLALLSPSGKIVANTTNGRGIFTDIWPQLKNVQQLSEPLYVRDNILVAPLVKDGQSLGYLLAAEADQADVSLLGWGAETIATHIANVDALESMTDELISAWDQLELIYRVTGNLTLTSDLLEALQAILEETRRVVNTEDGFVLLKTDNDFIAVTCYQAQAESLQSDALLNNLLKANRVIVCNDPASCRAMWPEPPDSVARLLATSLQVVDEDAQAAIGLVNKIDKDFNAGDAKLLAALAQQVASVIKNVLAHERAIVEQRLSRELEIAAEIQASLLPPHLPKVDGVSMAVSSVAASEVGGDFYDFITLDDHHLTVIIGDVSGKGIPAAMLTSVTRTMLRVEAMRGEPPHEIIRQANNVLQQDLNRVDAFVTVFVATIDTVRGTLAYASAGHTPTLLFRSDPGHIEQLKATSLPIGVLFGDIEQPSGEIVLAPNDVLVCYTDGIIEARSPQGTLFGLDRLEQLVATEVIHPAKHMRKRIQDDVDQFCNHTPNDDATLMIMKMLPHPTTTLSNQTRPSNSVQLVEFTYPADVDYLHEISTEIAAVCRQLPGFPRGAQGEDFICLIELAISEICTNIIKHSYSYQGGEIKGTVTLVEHGVKLDFYDQGASFDPDDVPKSSRNPHELNEGGYGLHIVQQIMDGVSYKANTSKGNHWHLEKYLSGK